MSPENKAFFTKAVVIVAFISLLSIVAAYWCC